MEQYTPLQLREVFHIEFLRWLSRTVKAEHYAVKGGVNLRFFFKSIRYSEDMDLDVAGISVAGLKEGVMKMLDNRLFQDNLKPFGIDRITAPDMLKAKQTETTQRFKVHLISSSGEDLFTKIEFSRRGFSGDVVMGTIDEMILRTYRLAPLLAPHYDACAALTQKLYALAGRASVQARDIFDIHILNSQRSTGDKFTLKARADIFSKAHERIFEVGFGQFRDTVVAYLSDEDQAAYNNPASWEEIQLKAANFIEEARKDYA